VAPDAQRENAARVGAVPRGSRVARELMTNVSAVAGTAGRPAGLAVKTAPTECRRGHATTTGGRADGRPNGRRQRRGWRDHLYADTLPSPHAIPLIVIPLK